MKYTYLILLAVSLYSCGESETAETEEPTPELEEQVEDEALPVELPLFQETDSSLIVSHTGVIFLFPDSTEYATMEAEYSEDDLMEVVSGMNWYPFTVKEELDSTEFQYIDSKAQTFVFNKSDGSTSEL